MLEVKHWQLLLSCNRAGSSRASQQERQVTCGSWHHLTWYQPQSGEHNAATKPHAQLHVCPASDVPRVPCSGIASIACLLALQSHTAPHAHLQVCTACDVPGVPLNHPNACFKSALPAIIDMWLTALLQPPASLPCNGMQHHVCNGMPCAHHSWRTPPHCHQLPESPQPVHGQHLLQFEMRLSRRQRQTNSWASCNMCVQDYCHEEDLLLAGCSARISLN